MAGRGTVQGDVECLRAHVCTARHKHPCATDALASRPFGHAHYTGRRRVDLTRAVYDEQYLRWRVGRGDVLYRFSVEALVYMRSVTAEQSKLKKQMAGALVVRGA